ncbi:MAG: biotin--[acetyl-CoA-carboxylase] ligase [Candidatus Aminicenantes bacterium]|nr:biotin--[acetyl-CoA-carboxylase] ligase [Candidatus Aminicenantes bacterium]
MKIGAKINRTKSCPSTNDLAKELALAGEEEGTVVISDEQTKGRGMKGRKWYSARKKGIYLSVILRPSHSNISLLPLVAGLAVADAVYDSVGLRIKLRWPNDLIWGKKKLGGILCEGGFLGDRINYAILGIGLNMNHGRDDFPEEIRHQATSLKLISKEDMDENILLRNLWPALNQWYGRFLQNEKGKIISHFQENSILPLGKEITLITESGEVSGIYRGVHSQGSLILESQGKRTSFFSAEIKTLKHKGGMR